MPPIIEESKCSRCGNCVENCTEDVFFGSRKKDLPQVDLERIYVYHTGCDEDAAYLVDAIRGMCSPQELSTTLAGLVIGSHAGPNAVGIIYALR